MPTPIFAGRHTADLEGDFVVFLIGMRVNRPWKLRKWLTVARAMPPMIRHLEEHPEAGCLATRQGMLSPLQPFIVQYWRSFDDLERFAELWETAVPGSVTAAIWPPSAAEPD